MAVSKKSNVVEFEYEGSKFQAVKSELESYETNKQLALGGNAFYLAVGRIFDGRDIEYSRVLGGSYNSMVGLVNAAFDANAIAKN